MVSNTTQSSASGTVGPSPLLWSLCTCRVSGLKNMNQLELLLLSSRTNVVSDQLSGDVVAGECEPVCCRRWRDDAAGGKDSQELAECCHTVGQTIGQGWRTVKC